MMWMPSRQPWCPAYSGTCSGQNSTPRRHFQAMSSLGSRTRRTRKRRRQQRQRRQQRVARVQPP
ncbi:unnamed protein product, partial [Ectocarpus sp. 6 AP-2014]